jgi:predicted enzyme related to lactoylglutathione lyase
MEVHMDVPFAETLADIEAHGGTVIGDRPKDATDDWVTSADLRDPAGNLLNVWKCPPSRTWDEPEADYDKD